MCATGLAAGEWDEGEVTGLIGCAASAGLSQPWISSHLIQQHVWHAATAPDSIWIFLLQNEPNFSNLSVFNFST